MVTRLLNTSLDLACELICSSWSFRRAFRFYSIAFLIRRGRCCMLSEQDLLLHQSGQKHPNQREGFTCSEPSGSTFAGVYLRRALVRLRNDYWLWLSCGTNFPLLQNRRVQMACLTGDVPQFFKFLRTFGCLSDEESLSVRARPSMKRNFW
jgi:hypothetical protein